MAESIDIVASGKMLEVRLTGKLTKEAYEKTGAGGGRPDQRVRQACGFW